MAVLSDDMGGITAYAAAVNRGYTGTKEEFEQLMYSYTEVAERAEAAAGNAHESEEASIEAKDISVSAKNEAVSARDAAVSARDASISAKNDSESARDAAISAKDDTLVAKDAVMSAKGSVDETSANFSEAVTAAISDVNAAGRNQKELAKTHAVDSEAWAVGQREGADVGVSDETYHNNSKYYAEQSALAKSETESARDTAITAKNEAVSAKNEAETAKGDAQDIVADINAKSEQIDQNAEDISDLQTAISTKAEIDGNYENLTAGTAEQLIGEVVSEDNDPYIIRKSIADGSDRLYDQIVGGTINWNQFVFITSNNETVNGVTYTIDRENGTVTLTGTATANSYLNCNISKPMVEGHKLYIRGCPPNGSAATYNGRDGYVAGDNNKDMGAGAIISAKSNSVYQIQVASGTDVTGKVFKPQIFDLTAMFGSTIADYIYQLEQTNRGDGVAFFKALFPNDYYPYNAGELVSVSGLSAHKMTGFNQWDEEWEVGNINATTGQNEAGSVIRSKNYIPVLPNTVYYANVGTGTVSNFVWFEYDADKNYLGQQKVVDNGHGVFTTSANAHYIRFRLVSGYGTTYNHDICINPSDPTKNGTYEPYESHSYPLDSNLTLRGIPKLDANNQLYYDGDTYDADGTVTRRYGVVDLGTLTWQTRYTGTTKKTVSSYLAHKYPYSGTLLPFIGESVSVQGKVGGVGELSTPDEHNDGIYQYANSSVPSENVIYIVLDANATPNGKLIYPLATPITEQAQPFTNPQIVDGEGTEEYITTSIVPVGHVTKYIENLKQKLQDAPQSPSTDGDYIVRRADGVNEYVPLAPILDTKADVTDFLKAFPTDTITEAVASFSDGANLPLKSLIVNIDPIQDLHGQDAPYPAGGGKNLVALNVSPVREQILSAVTISEQTEQKVTMESSSAAYACLRLFYHLKAGTYTASVSATASDSYEPAISIYKYSSPYGLIVQGIKSGTPQSFTISEDLDIDIRLFATQETAAARTVTFSNFQIESGSTATAYVPYSNICPISGWSDVNIEHTGANLYSREGSVYGAPVYGADGTVASYPDVAVWWIKVKPSTKYTISCIQTSQTTTYLRFGACDANKGFISRVVMFSTNQMPGTITTPSNCEWAQIGVNQYDAAHISQNDWQICIKEGTDSTYEPYNGQSINISLGQTVYGAKLYPLEGKAVIDRAMVDLGTLNWRQDTTTRPVDGATIHAFYAELYIAKRIGNNVIPNMRSSQFIADTITHVDYGGQDTIKDNICSGADVNGRVWVYGSTYNNMTTAEFKTAMSGVMLCYEVTTPTTITLTPHEVSALLGSNNVWADTGDSTVEYRADPTLYIQRKIAEALANTSEG